MWPDWPQYMDLWVIEKNSLWPFKICIWLPLVYIYDCIHLIKLWIHRPGRSKLLLHFLGYQGDRWEVVQSNMWLVWWKQVVVTTPLPFRKGIFKHSEQPHKKIGALWKKKKKKKALAAMQNLCFPPCGSESDYPNTVNTHLWRTPLTS